MVVPVLKGALNILIIAPPMFAAYCRSLHGTAITDDYSDYLSTARHFDKIVIIDFAEELEDTEMFPRSIRAGDKVVRCRIPKSMNQLRSMTFIGNLVKRLVTKEDIFTNVWD